MKPMPQLPFKFTGSKQSKNYIRKIGISKWKQSLRSIKKVKPSLEQMITIKISTKLGYLFLIDAWNKGVSLS